MIYSLIIVDENTWLKVADPIGIAWISQGLVTKMDDLDLFAPFFVWTYKNISKYKLMVFNTIYLPVFDICL